MTNADDNPEGKQLYYILDNRQCVGNCALWWRPDAQGYTCDLDDAGLYPESKLRGLRETDIPVRAEMAHRYAVRHVSRSRVLDELETEKRRKVFP